MASPLPDIIDPSPSFAHIANPRARRAKECAQELENLIGKYPELARHLEKSLKPIRREIKRTPQSDQARVLSALEKGDGMIREIAQLARLPQGTTYIILNRLSAAGLVEIRDEYVIQEPGRGGHRRARKIYSLRHTRP